MYLNFFYIITLIIQSNYDNFFTELNITYNIFHGTLGKKR